MNYFRRMKIRRERSRLERSPEQLENYRLAHSHWLDKPGVHAVVSDGEKLIVYCDTEDDDIHAYSMSKLKVVKSAPFKALPAEGEAQGINRWGKVRPMVGGISIGNWKSSAGTFCLLVRDKATKTLRLLSNYHVFARDDMSMHIGDKILQPGPYDGGAEKVGSVINYIPLKNGCLADCAVADVTDNAIARVGVLGCGTPMDWYDPTVGMLVKKSGRTSGFTKGKIIGKGDAKVSYGSYGNIVLKDQWFTDTFSQPGDSGSAFLEQKTNRFIGILFAGNGVQTILSPASAIFNGLGVELCPPPYKQILDLSHHNGDIVDVDKMEAKGVAAVILKASQGNSYYDDKFDRNWRVLEGRKPKRSAYHFNDPVLSGSEQFDQFMRALGERIPDFPLMLDSEYAHGLSRDKITAVTQAFTNLLNGWLYNHGLQSTIQYSRGSWWNVYIKRWTGFTQGWSMQARWDVDLPVYGKDDQFWMKDWDGKITWIATDCGAKMYIPRTIWQWSADGNNLGADYGVSSRSVDLSFLLDDSLLDASAPPPPEEPPDDTIGMGKVVVVGLRKRMTPGITGVWLKTFYTYNQTVDIYEKQIIGKDLWVRTNTDEWGAAYYQGRTYIKLS